MLFRHAIRLPTLDRRFPDPLGHAASMARRTQMPEREEDAGRRYAGKVSRRGVRSRPSGPSRHRRGAASPP